jgi:hypothetical protein
MAIVANRFLKMPPSLSVTSSGSQLSYSCVRTNLRSAIVEYTESVEMVFWTLSIVCISTKLQRFGSWIFFRLPSVVILLNYRRQTKSKKTILQIITHHRQNPLDFTNIECFTTGLPYIVWVIRKVISSKNINTTLVLFFNRCGAMAV